MSIITDILIEVETCRNCAECFRIGPIFQCETEAHEVDIDKVAAACPSYRTDYPIRIARDGTGECYASRTERRNDYGDETIGFFDRAEGAIDFIIRQMTGVE